LIANAGISKAATIEQITVEDFDALFAVNVRTPFFLVQRLMPIMCRGSSIVLVSSPAAHAALGTLSAYAATKGAIDTLVKHFAAALGERGIRVNAVAPGVVPTDMSSFAKTADGRDFALGIQALKRMAQPDDIGAVVAFLASDLPMMLAGSPAIRSASTAAPSSELLRGNEQLLALISCNCDALRIAMGFARLSRSGAGRELTLPSPA